MDDFRIELPPVGVKLIRGDVPEGLAGVPVYRGLSYCEAVYHASGGEELTLLPGSIEICKWSPVALGLKRPETRFEMGIRPRPEKAVDAIYLARVEEFSNGLTPDVVILRGTQETLGRILGCLGDEELALEHRHLLERSALAVLRGGGPRTKIAITRWLNRILAWLNRSDLWQRMTHQMFKSSLVTSAWEELISRTTADMSICRNSTTIPSLTGKANLSFFCSGGIAWGMNRHDHMTSGLPWERYLTARDELGLPGIGGSSDRERLPMQEVGAGEKGS